MDKYILDGQGNPVVEPDPIKWARWYKNDDNRVVGSNWFGGEAIHVSTVFLSLSCISKDLKDNREMLYETMVFADKPILARLILISGTNDRSIISLFFGGTNIQKRYATRSEAEQGHKTMCKFVETCLSNGLVILPESI
jgi:hypothetical protein